MKKIKQIPLYHQNPQAVGGLDMHFMRTKKQTENHDILGEHRDDHYILLLLTKGNVTMHCDMEQLTMKATGALIVKPYQVHAYVNSSTIAEGYFMSIASFLIPGPCHAIFEALDVAQQYLKIPPGYKENIIKTAALLQRAFIDLNPFKTSVINGLFTALINHVAALYVNAKKPANAQQNQPHVITVKFKQLLTANSFLQKPSFFAEKLHVSTSHLNDCVKATTGFSVTHWIQDLLTLEAKRHLYYTNNDIKEIAYNLGFEDHTYFSRLFKKITNETPLAFRNKFRE